MGYCEQDLGARLGVVAELLAVHLLDRETLLELDCLNRETLLALDYDLLLLLPMPSKRLPTCIEVRLLPGACIRSTWHKNRLTQRCSILWCVEEAYVTRPSFLNKLTYVAKTTNTFDGHYSR